MLIRTGFVDISPKAPVQLGANSKTRAVVRRIQNSLEANLLIIGEAENRILIVSIDTLFVGETLRSELLARFHDIDEERIILAASHTHSGTMLDDSKPSLGEVSATEQTRIVNLISDKYDRLSKTEPISCTLRFGQSDHSHGISRRKKRAVFIEKAAGRYSLRFNAMFMGPNPKLEIDRKARRLQFLSSDKSVLAELWSTSIHPTAFPRNGAVSADYIGIVRDWLRLKNEGLPVLFLQGFSGDVRPTTPTTSFFESLISGKRFEQFDEAGFMCWSKSLANLVGQIQMTNVPSEPHNVFRTPFDKNLLIAGSAGPSIGYAYLIQFGQIGIAALPTEAVSSYQVLLQTQFADDLDIVFGVGCIDHVWGYSPNKRMIDEGGYESVGFLRSFGATEVNRRVEKNIVWIFGQLRDLLQSGKQSR